MGHRRARQRNVEPEWTHARRPTGSLDNENCAMNRITPVPFALAADGTVFVNAALFDEVELPEEILERALAEPGHVFVGVELDELDLAIVSPRIASACREASAFVIGRRQRLAKAR